MKKHHIYAIWAAIIAFWVAHFTTAPLYGYRHQDAWFGIFFVGLITSVVLLIIALAAFTDIENKEKKDTKAALTTLCLPLGLVLVKIEDELAWDLHQQSAKGIPPEELTKLLAAHTASNAAAKAFNDELKSFFAKASGKADLATYATARAPVLVALRDTALKANATYQALLA